MTQTDKADRGGAEILVIGQLELHRETLEHLTRDRPGLEAERAPTRGIKCTGRCLTAFCSGGCY